MKKVFYDNWIAKHLLFATYSTITLCAWVLTKCESLSQRVINHECTHARQWIELTVAAGMLIWIGMLVFGHSPWWFLLAPLVFYAWYVLEYLIRRLLGFFSGDSKQNTAYRLVSFEQEARLAENDPNYLENSNYFAWINFYKKRRWD